MSFTFSSRADTLLFNCVIASEFPSTSDFKEEVAAVAFVASDCASLTSVFNVSTSCFIVVKSSVTALTVFFKESTVPFTS